MKSNQPIINAGIFVLLALTWGSSFILMKFGLKSFNGVEVALMRISFAMLFILMIGYKSFKKLRKKDLPAIVLVGFFGNGIPYALFAWAIMHIPSSVAGIMNSLTPLFTLIVGVILYKNPIRKFQVIGVLLGLFGAVYLIQSSNSQAIGGDAIYAILPIIASMMYAIGVNTISAKLQHLDSVTITTFALTVVGIPALISIFLFTDIVETLQTDPIAMASTGYIAILGLMGTGIAIILFNYLIKNASTLYAVSITYAVPIIAVGMGALDDEPITWSHLIGIVTILIGVFLINFKKYKK